MLNYEIFEGFTLGAAAIVPIIVALVQAFKLTGRVKERYAPLLSLIIGVLISFLLARGLSWGATTLIGLLFGLSASGLYSGMKVTMLAIQSDKRIKNKDNIHK